MKYPYYVIDAFALEPFTGNPAAVVLEAGGLDEQAMQQIAAEFNLSETTFILPGDSAEVSSVPTVRFRWFTPTTEVDMCGHATVAGIHALVATGFLERPGPAKSIVLKIQTKSGTLTGFVEALPSDSRQFMIWLEMIPPTLTKCQIDALEYARALNLSNESFDVSLPPVTTQDRDILVFVRDFMVLNGAAPDFATLGAILSRAGLRGLCLATTRTVTPSLHVQSRFFAPTAGVDEDPVTGSMHGPLAAYLAANDRAPADGEIAAMSCGQARPGGRGGLLHALVRTRPDGNLSVRIGGRAFTVMRGELFA